MRWPGWTAAAVALATCLTGCTSTAAPAPAPAPTTLAAYYAQRLDWQPCDDGFQCAELVVPFDYAQPDGRRFTLPVLAITAWFVCWNVFDLYFDHSSHINYMAHVSGAITGVALGICYRVFAPKKLEEAVVSA